MIPNSYDAIPANDSRTSSRSQVLDDETIKPTRFFCWAFQLSDKFWSYFHLFSWFSFNVCITLYCKSLFSDDLFPYPMIMSAVHMLFTSVGVAFLQQFGWGVGRTLAPEMRFTVLWFSVLFTTNIWLSNASLLSVSVSVHQVVRTIIPLITMGISAVVFNQKYPMSLLPSVLLVIGSVALTVWGGLDGLSWFGLMVALFGSFFSSLKGIVTQRIQSGSVGFDSLDLLYYLCPLATVNLLVVATMIGETSRLLNNTIITASLIGHLSCLGFIAFGINVFSFRCSALFTPLTMNIAGNVKQVLTGLVSLFLFGGVCSAPLILGMFGAAIGATWYSMESNKWKRNQIARGSKETDIEEGIEQQEINKSGNTSNESVVVH